MQGQLALVTGASRGIGLAIAEALAREGATVVIVSRKQAGLDQAAAELAERGVTVIPRACHVGKPEQLAGLFDWLDATHGPVRMLVNNAATNPYFGPMLGAEWAAWDKTFDVNLKGPFELSRRVGQRLIDAELPGSIVNISSIFGLTAAPMQGIYGMTKAALVSLTRTLAHEWGGAGIRVNCVAPGLVETRFAQALLTDPALVSNYTDRAALPRVGQPQDIAAMVAWLCSDASGWVTGQTFPVDGGYLVG